MNKNHNKCLPQNSDKSAFTLAEVLITLGIIGVVAAMTLPTLIRRHQEKIIIAKLKKNYSTMQQAYLMAINDKGSIETWGLANSNDGRDSNEEQDTSLYDDTENILYHLKDYLKVTKYCGLEKGCWYSTPIYSLNGSVFGYPDRGYFSKAILADGSMIMTYSDNSNSGFYRIDVNGATPPNTMGKDVFSFEILKNKIIPWGVSSYPFDYYCNPKKSGVDQGRGCTAWVIINENMDYLHCEGLSLNKNTKCK